MKKVLLFLLFMLFIPLNIYALEYKTETLKEVCTEEGIEFNHDNYIESDNKINIYLEVLDVNIVMTF